jgi:hypothetical protein
MARGGIIGKFNQPTSASASGVWSLREHELLVDTNWPSKYPTTGLVSRYPLTSNGDDIVGGFNCSNNGSVAFNGVGATFNGTSGQALINTNEQQLSQTSFSLCAWVNSTTMNSTTREIISSGRFDYNLRLTSGNFYTFCGFSGTSTDAAVSATPYINIWTHMVGTYDGTTLRLYINGSLAASTGYGGASLANRNFIIGNHPTITTRTFIGTISDVLVYDRPLTDSEISSIYQRTNTY